MIDSATIQKIKEIADVVEVVGDFVQLKKSGQNYKGLSPFTNEKTPSFFVSPSKGIYKCFSTGKGGDAISFIQEVEGLDYLETIRFLAKRYGIEIEESEPTPEELASRNERESLFIVLNYAKDYFKSLLLENEEGKSIGWSYFKERGFSEDTIDKFDLGYSLEAWDGFTKEAKSKQYTPELLVKAGLTIRKEDKEYDRFRGRVVFPIHNVSGKVIAFGARTLKKDTKEPKYVNSPETDVYHKSDIVYGIYQAKNEIRNADNCFLVEGYTDVISMYQAGIKNVVASSGTALTKEQIKLISRYTENITVLYDGDTAGIRASLRGIDLILEEGMNVRVVLLPEGEDPDSYSQKMGADFLSFLKDNQKDFITFKTELVLESAGNDPVKRAEVIKEIIESIAKVPDSIKRAVFFKQCSALLQIEESTLISEYNRLAIKKSKENQSKANQDFEEPPPDLFEDPSPEVKTQDTVNPVVLQEMEIIRLLLNYSSFQVDEESKLAEYLLSEIDDIEFEHEIYAKILLTFKEELAKGNTIDSSYFINGDDEKIKQEVINLVTSRYELSDRWESHNIFVPKDEDILSNITYKNILRLKWRKIKFMVKEIEDQLVHADSIEEISNLQKIHVKLKESEVQVAQILGNVLT